MQSSELVITDRLSFWYRPDGHGSPADAPSAQYSPGSQSGQAVSPSPDWNLPATHLTHPPCPVAGCTVPGLQSVGAKDPVEQNEAASHGVHCPLLANPSALLYDPSEHGSAAEEPSAQNEPAGQVSQAVSPDPSW